MTHINSNDEWRVASSGTLQHDIIKPSDPHTHSEDVRCAICDGGLAICKRCGRAEAELDEPCEPVPIDTGQSIANPATGECAIPECPCHDFSRRDVPHLPTVTATDQQPLWADAATVRAALADTLDSYPPAVIEHLFWHFNPEDESEAETQIRGVFIDSVIARIRQLQQPPHNATNLADYCDHHKRRRLGPPTRQVCIDCQEGRQ
jgi:hypothetical protein